MMNSCRFPPSEKVLQALFIEHIDVAICRIDLSARTTREPPDPSVLFIGNTDENFVSRNSRDLSRSALELDDVFQDFSA
jgi:hypothetical protein